MVHTQKQFASAPLRAVTIVFALFQPEPLAFKEAPIIHLVRHISIFAIAAVLASSAIAQERKIKRADLPSAVEKTVVAQSVGATVRGFSQEKENGQVYYEAEMTVNGHSKDILIDAKGVVVEVEEEVALAAVPAAVQAGLQAKAGAARIAKVESITKKDKLVAYEAQVVSAGKKTEIQVGPDGKPLDHEE